MKSTKPKNIALIGMMGSGKTCVAKELALMVDGACLVETDAMIENQAAMCISDIFSSKGEVYFRELETNLIRSFIDQENLIISTGGGMFLRAENQAMLKQNAFCVYLSASTDTIYERIKDDKSRPLLQCENPKGKIEELLKVRNSEYLKAHDMVVTDGKKPKEIAQEILEKYKNYGN